MTAPPDLAADAAILAAARGYFDARRARVDDFVRRHFRGLGPLRLHRAALGLDILRAPVNVMLAPVFVLSRLGSLLLRLAGLRRAGAWLGTRQLMLRTSVAREIEALIVTDLLELPWPEGRHRSSRDALTEAVLGAPQVRDLIRKRQSVQEAGALGNRVAQTVGEYSGTRAAVAEMTTALGTLGAGAMAFQALTPGMVSIAPTLAVILAQNAAIASFPLGASAGAMWYGVFPTGANVGLTALTLLGLIMLGSVVAAFAGILADPVQARIGIHRRRLLRLIDALEAEFTGSGPRAFAAREHYMARLFDLADAGVMAARLFRG